MAADGDHSYDGRERSNRGDRCARRGGRPRGARDPITTATPAANEPVGRATLTSADLGDHPMEPESRRVTRPSVHVRRRRAPTEPDLADERRHHRDVQIREEGSLPLRVAGERDPARSDRRSPLIFRVLDNVGGVGKVRGRSAATNVVALHSASSLMGDRLMAGRRILAPSIKVRILVPQPAHLHSLS